MKNYEKCVEELLLFGIADGLEPEGFIEEDKEMMKNLADLTDKLIETLSDAQVELYNEIEKLEIEHEYLCEKACFIKGFRLAQNLSKEK